ncbi:MAG: histidine phosphatase family protein, partial [Victivallales bacterium]|nr:histidine phosphatase family protein [Victivallales bacterium]
CFGTWEGLAIAELAPKLVQLRDERLAMRPPGGETCLDLRKRVADCLLRLAQRHLGQTVLVVSHGGAIAQMFCMMFQALPGVGMPTTTNSGITRLKWLAEPLGKTGNASDLIAGAQGGWRMLSWNETTHLVSRAEVEGV